MPCQLCGQCLEEGCRGCDRCSRELGLACAPCAAACSEVLCHPLYPFSLCNAVTFLGAAALGAAALTVAAPVMGSTPPACSSSDLPMVVLVHTPLLCGHALFARHLNRSFLSVERGTGVVRQCWALFLYDPAVLAYMLLLGVNIYWLDRTARARDAALASGCCSARASLCELASALAICTWLFFALAPVALGVALLGECCLADEQQRRQARARQAAADALRRGRGASSAAGVFSSALLFLLGSIPLVGCLFRPTTPLAATAATTAGGGRTPPTAYAAPVRAQAPTAYAAEPAARAQPYAPPPPTAASMERGPSKAQQPSAPALGAGARADDAPPPPYSPHAAPAGGPSAGAADGGEASGAAALVGKLASKAAQGLGQGLLAGASAGMSVATSAFARAQEARAPQAASSGGSAAGGGAAAGKQPSAPIMQ